MSPNTPDCTTRTSMRKSYAESRDLALALGFRGDFQRACIDVLGRPTHVKPTDWVWAAAKVAKNQEVANDADLREMGIQASGFRDEDYWMGPDDEREPSGPGIDEPWEVTYGPTESPYAC